MALVFSTWKIVETVVIENRNTDRQAVSLHVSKVLDSTVRMDMGLKGLCGVGYRLVVL